MDDFSLSVGTFRTFRGKIASLIQGCYYPTGDLAVQRRRRMRFLQGGC